MEKNFTIQLEEEIIKKIKKISLNKDKKIKDYIGEILTEALKKEEKNVLSRTF
jgi:hypothetical protein